MYSTVRKRPHWKSSLWSSKLLCPKVAGLVLAIRECRTVVSASDADQQVSTFSCFGVH